MKDYEQINKNKITHILSIHELEKVKLHDVGWNYIYYIKNI